MTRITTALRGIYARLCYFTPRCINDDESHFAPRNPGEGLTRGAEVHATRALIRYPTHKREEGRGFLLWGHLSGSRLGPPHDWLRNIIFLASALERWPPSPSQRPSFLTRPKRRFDESWCSNMSLFFFRLCLLRKILPWYQCFNGGRRACLCNMVLTFVSLLVAL